MSNDALNTGDLEILDRLGGSAERHDDELLERAASLWKRAERLTQRLAGRLPGRPPFRCELWPWRQEGETFPFLWARMKREGAGEVATHIGLFVSPGHSNLCLDVEKDRIEAGEAAEDLDHVLDFYSRNLESVLPRELPDDLRVWTDPGNVMSVPEFLEASFDEFMAAHQDPEHPWPNLGYLLSADQVVADDWEEEMADRARVLVPVYDAMVARFRS